MSNESQSTLAAKLADVKSTIKEPEKSGTLEYVGHDYWTRGDLFGAIRKELAERNIDWSPESELIDLRSGPDGIMAVVEVEITFTDGDTGETGCGCSGLGQSISDDDKSVASATTQAIRFAMMNKFQICDDMVEAMHGQTSSQNRNVNRETSSSNQAPFERIKNRVQALEFSKKQFAAFGDEIAKREGVNSKSDIPESRLALWADRLEKADDDKAREKIMKLIGDQAA